MWIKLANMLMKKISRLSLYKKTLKPFSPNEIKEHFGDTKYKILVGCAPCQTFSKYTKGKNNKNDEKWTLLDEFLRLISEVQPEIISMENVPDLIKYPIFENFIDSLKQQGYFINYKIIFCPDYGIPQNRKRLVLLASKIKI
ncbi:DNA cytosine methyltransferase [Campylobacter bilis]|uniref:DNA cytosine methyltransferase n=2 Tax=Campylobacter bilis TaxID=2691918 RepID=UPI0035946A2E